MDYLKSFSNMIKCWIWKQPERLLTKFEMENLSPEEAEYLIKIRSSSGGKAWRIIHNYF